MTPVRGEFDEEALRREVRAWVHETWNPSLKLRDWWRLLADSGWGFPTWPNKWFGKDLPQAAAAVVHEELVAARVIGPPGGAGPSMAAPVLFAFGSGEQRQRWLPPIASGDEHWAQFFSEPGAGSDLASVQTRAVRDGDDWIVNGQKVWNSGTQDATRALLVARTDADVPKHKGITFFVIDLDQSGIEVRPIKQMNGRAEFNETFLTDARVPDANRIGPVNGGWAVAMTVLTHERSSAAGGGDTKLRTFPTGASPGFLDRRLRDLLATNEPDPIGGANALPLGTLPAVVALARARGRLDDPIIRDRIAGLHTYSEALRLTAARGNAAAASGRRADAESSVAYLGGVNLIRRYRDLVADIAGAEAMLSGTDVAMSITTAPAHGIQGGTEQIQRNVIGERLLGLAREPQVDRDALPRGKGGHPARPTITLTASVRDATRGAFTTQGPDHGFHVQRRRNAPAVETTEATNDLTSISASTVSRTSHEPGQGTARGGADESTIRLLVMTPRHRAVVPRGAVGAQEWPGPCRTGPRGLRRGDGQR